MTHEVCGNFYRERSTYVLCHRTHNLPSNYKSTNETHGMGRGGEIWTGRRSEGVIKEGGRPVYQEDQAIFFFSNEKERKLCKKRKRRRGIGGEGGCRGV